MNARLLSLYLLAAALCISQPSNGQSQPPYQAESATLAGGASVGNSAGVSYAVYLTQRGTASTPGSSITFTSVTSVTVNESKTYSVVFRYAASRPFASSLSIYVNGTDVTQALFPSTNSGAAWATHTGPLNLRSGSNTVMLRYDADDNEWINLDYIQVKPEEISAVYSLGAASTAGWFPQEVCVDKFTGTAQLYIPLHTVQANGIAVPVGLSYVASGVRGDDRGGQVGVNWGLTGRVSIQRKVRGYHDDIDQTVGTETRYRWLVYPAGSTPAGKIDAVPNAPSDFAATACTSSEVVAH